MQLALDLGDAPDEAEGTDLPDMTSAERVVAELDVLGLDASRHVLDFYQPLLHALGVTRSPDLVAQRSRELALLRALGASRRQVVRSVLLEAFVIGLLGATLGVGLGIGLAVAVGLVAYLLASLLFPDRF